MPADVMKLARRVVTRLFQQSGFIEAGPDCVSRPDHHRQMSKTHLPVSHCFDCVPKLANPLPDSDPIGRGVTRHVAVEADPVDRTYRAVVCVRVGGGKVSRFLGERELHQVDRVTLANEVFPSLLISRVGRAKRTNVLRRQHETNGTNICSKINGIYRRIS
jgi:hypothetical protein